MGSLFLFSTQNNFTEVFIQVSLYLAFVQSLVLYSTPPEKLLFSSYTVVSPITLFLPAMRLPPPLSPSFTFMAYVCVCVYTYILETKTGFMRGKYAVFLRLLIPVSTVVCSA